MYKLLLISFLMLTKSVNTAEAFEKYCNARFSFCLGYPISFVSQSPPENGDGEALLSRDGLAEIRAFGSLAVEDFNTLEQEFTVATSKTKLTYKRITKDWFVFSGIDQKGEIVYRKTVRKKINYMGKPATQVFQTLMIKYPASQQSVYTPYCLEISKSLSAK